MSRIVSDSRGEKAIGLYMDNTLYPWLVENKAINSFMRVYEKESQVKGIDVVLEDRMTKEFKNIDEKAQLYYINNPVDSFAFEILFHREEKQMDGWFISGNNQTDYYMLMWIKSARETKVYRLVMEDFEEVEVYMIPKLSLQSYVGKYMQDVRILKKEAQKMILTKQEKKSIDEGIYLRYSMKGYDEKPVNLVIKKEILKSYAKHIFIVKKNDIKMIR